MVTYNRLDSESFLAMGKSCVARLIERLSKNTKTSAIGRPTSLVQLLTMFNLNVNLIFNGL